MGSLVSNAASDYIRRTANIPQYSAASMCGWYKAATGVKAVGATQHIATLGTTNSYGPIVRTDGALGVKLYGGSTSAVVASGSWSEDAWIFITFSTASAPAQIMKFYDSTGSLLGTSSRTDAQTPTWTVMDVAGNSVGGASAAGKYAYWKSWDAVLNDTEFGDEMFSPTFVRTTNANTGFADSTTDIGPNSRDWTLTSMDYDADTPPLDFGGLTPIVMTWTL
jgi:hypothetical protein